MPNILIISVLMKKSVEGNETLGIEENETSRIERNETLRIEKNSTARIYLVFTIQ